MICAVPCALPERTVIVAVPSATAVTRPDAFTVANRAGATHPGHGGPRHHVGVLVTHYCRQLNGFPHIQLGRSRVHCDRRRTGWIGHRWGCRGSGAVAAPHAVAKATPASAAHVRIMVRSRFIGLSSPVNCPRSQWESRCPSVDDAVRDRHRQRDREGHTCSGTRSILSWPGYCPIGCGPPSARCTPRFEKKAGPSGLNWPLPVAS